MGKHHGKDGYVKIGDVDYKVLVFTVSVDQRWEEVTPTGNGGYVELAPSLEQATGSAEIVPDTTLSSIHDLPCARTTSAATVKLAVGSMGTMTFGAFIKPTYTNNASENCRITLEFASSGTITYA